MNVIVVIGLPGSGKSTAVEAALAQLYDGEPASVAKPFAHERWGDDLVMLGRRRPGGFGGTDALSMSVNPKAIAFVEELAAEPVTVLAEGDRLSNAPFLTAAAAAADGALIIVLIDTPVELAKARAKARADELGTEPQADGWWKGRVTKVQNLTSTWAQHVQVIDARQEPDEVADELAAILRAATEAAGHETDDEPGTRTTELHVEYRRPEDLRVADRNPKAHADEDLQASLARYGYTEPIIEDGRTGQLVAGHGRRQMLMEAEAHQDPDAELPAGIKLDDEERWLAPVICGWSSTSAADAETFLLASNRLMELGQWDAERLARELTEQGIVGPEPKGKRKAAGGGGPTNNGDGNTAVEDSYGEREDKYRQREERRFVFDCTPDEAKRAEEGLAELSKAWGTERPATALRAVIEAAGDPA